MSFSYLIGSVGLGVLLLIAYAILSWFGIPTGNVVDWAIGIASFEWLILIVTIPWNIYFDAREVINEAAISRDKDIPVDEKQVRYVQKVSRWSLIGAITLHILSAIGLYLLAATGISVVGYASSAATLLFTALRPAVRAYEYLALRLARIRNSIQYPREDILELRNRFEVMEIQVTQMSEQLDLENPNSLVTSLKEDWQETRKQVAKLRTNLEQLEARNDADHERLSRESKSAIAQLTEDSQFLDHVREIIRFFKSA